MFLAPLSMLARERLRAMYETQDGFEIAQRDLDLRGPGELLGARQSGMALLKFADLAQDGAAFLDLGLGGFPEHRVGEEGLPRRAAHYKTQVSQ